LADKPLILFDLVSTLTQAGPRYAQAYIRMCQAWGMTPPAQDDILEALGEKNLKQIIAEFTPGLPAENIGKFMSDCNFACDAILADKSWVEELYPHARETLAALRDGGCTLGIFTGTRESAMTAQVAYHELDTLFDADFMRGKDNVRDGMVRNDELKGRQIAQMAARHGGPVIVVGDGMADLSAAKTAGVLFVGFASGARADALRKNGAVATFCDYDQLPGIIAQILRPAATPAVRPAGFSR
jgi:phosphoglycolate phosphatase-like HAD superfamily hydrolase